MCSSTIVDPFAASFEIHCASCHGINLEGKPPAGTALLGRDLDHGDSFAAISKSIARGFPSMPGWSDRLTAEEIRGLAIYIERVDLPAPHRALH